MTIITHAAKEIITMKVAIAILKTATHSNNIAFRKVEQAKILLLNGGDVAEAIRLANVAEGHANRGASLRKLALKIHKDPRK